MHIPDGYLGPITWVTMWVVMVPIWAIAARKLNKNLNTKQVPLLAIGAAFSFVIMMFNFPIPGGTTGHAVGGYPHCNCIGSLGCRGSRNNSARDSSALLWRWRYYMPSPRIASIWAWFCHLWGTVSTS